MMRSTFALAIALLLSVPIASTPAFAAPPSSKGAPVGYESKWKEILAAEKAEEYERAIALLNEIPAEKLTVHARLKKADLMVRLGKFVEAEAVLSALVKSPAADSIRATVQSDLDDLHARMPKLTIRLAAGGAKDLWVTVDDEHVGPPVTIPINPGTHLVAASREGKEVFKQKVTLQDSQTLEVEIDASVAPLGAPVANVSVPTPTIAPSKPADEPAASSGLRRATPAFAIALVLAGGSVASFIVMSAAQRTTEANCATQHSFDCDSNAAGAGRIRTWETLGWVSAGLSVAAIGAGLVLWTTAGASKEKRTATAAPMIGASALGLSIAGQF
jgi:hypothetical protein